MDDAVIQAQALRFSRSLGPSGARQFGGGMSLVRPVATSTAIRLVLAGIR